jgi:hypothetical protein
LSPEGSGNLTDRIRTSDRRRRGGLTSEWLLCRLLGLVFFSALVAAGARCADSPARAITSVGPGQKFAIGDLDGDRRPDLAYVETGRSDVSLTDYWIQLQLTASQRQTILVTAPTGGLEIVARDVNGDHALDLVLTTVWLKQPVAILLNDGHGSFSQVDPTIFPEAFDEPGTSWGSPDQQTLDAIGFPPQSRAGGCWAGVRLPFPRSQVDGVPSSDCGSLLAPFFIPHLGRAPPSELLHL